MFPMHHQIIFVRNPDLLESVENRIRVKFTSKRLAQHTPWDARKGSNQDVFITLFTLYLDNFTCPQTNDIEDSQVFCADLIIPYKQFPHDLVTMILRWSCIVHGDKMLS